MTCPKCQGSMRQYERSNVNIDQCSECRGIFLDRGELERLIDAEAAWQGSQAAPTAGRPAPIPAHTPQPYQQPGYQQSDHHQSDHQQSDHQQHGYGHGHPRKKRKSFLEDLFD